MPENAIAAEMKRRGFSHKSTVRRGRHAMVVFSIPLEKVEQTGALVQEMHRLQASGQNLPKPKQAIAKLIEEMTERQIKPGLSSPAVRMRMAAANATASHKTVFSPRKGAYGTFFVTIKLGRH